MVSSQYNRKQVLILKDLPISINCIMYGVKYNVLLEYFVAQTIILFPGLQTKKVHKYFVISIQKFNEVVVVSGVWQTICCSLNQHSVHQKQCKSCIV